MAVSSNGSLLPMSEQTLLRFCSHLADRLNHSSIKVYLSAIRSLHIDQGFPDPLVNCLQLQHLIQGIKRHQGSSLTQRQPVTADLTQIIQRSLDTHSSEHIMLWAACCLGFFGFLRAGEFTVNCAFDPSIHFTVQDLQVDAEVNPSSLRVHTKSSKTDPFRQGCFIYLGHGQAPLCPISALAPCVRERESLGSFQATAFALGLPPRPRNAAFQITLSRPWVGGPVMHINSTFEPQWNQWNFGSFWEATLVTGTLSRDVANTYV